MVDRPDHFERMRFEPEPAEVIDKDTPLVMPALIEYLESIEAQEPPPPRATTIDQAVLSLGEVARKVGRREVIEHLKTLVRKPS